MRTSGAPRVSFKAQMLKVREDAIIQAVNRLLAEKGFDAMTVDEVAARVGIAKASLYKHFASKEALAAAAMVRVLHQAQHFCASLSDDGAPIANLRAVTRWAMALALAGGMPALPSQHSTLRTALMGSRDYTDALIAVSDRLGGWIRTAQADGSLSTDVPAMAVLYTLYARACDPVLEFLKMTGRYQDDEIIDLAMRSCFDGLHARPRSHDSPV